MTGRSALRRDDSAAPADQPSPLPHLAPLDGLRALAVATVLAYHTGADWAVGGFLGVDLFFVLSGFLITTLLVIEWQRQHRISLRRFYARRALRLLPAVLALCVFLLIVGPVASGVAARDALWKGVAGTTFYFANWQQAFGLLPLFQLTDHTWSLAIEEQFYVVWPPVLLLIVWIGRRRGREPLRLALIVAMTLALVSAVLRLVLWSGADSIPRLYYGTDTRADSLLIGSALALAYTTGRLRSTKRSLQVLAPLALALIIVAFVMVKHDTPALYLGGFTVVAVLTAVVIAGVVMAPRTTVAQLLALAPLVAIGRISYGIYLWHWPVFRYLHEARLGLSWGPTQLVRIAVTLAAATLSFFIIERPLLRFRHRFDPPDMQPGLPRR